MEIIQSSGKAVRPHNDPMRLQDLVNLCLAKWPWFILSVTVCVGLAVAYLLRTPPVYTRSATLLIKQEARNSRSFSTMMNSFGELGLFSSATNIYNEIMSLQSPDLALEVVRRLNLDVDYQVDGMFHRKTLYSRTLPVKVSFRDLAYNDFCTMKLTLTDDGKIQLSDFTRNGAEVADQEPCTATFGKELKTPLGRLTVKQSPYFKEASASDKVIYVNRVGLMAAVGGCQGRLSVTRDDEEATVLTLTYQDINTQRAEDYLNTLISVYNENWVKDRNQIAVSTSQFINERLAVIESELGHVDSNISDYKSENLIPDISAASNMYMNTANQAKVQIIDLNNQLYMARYIRDHISNRNSKDQLLPANSGIHSNIIENQISAYNDMMLQRNSLVSNSSEENPLVQDLDKKLGEMRGAIVSSIDNQVNTLNTQIRGLEGIQGASTSRLSSNPKQAKYLLSVERQQKVKESLYLFLLQKREENELSQAFTAYNTRVISSPSGSMSPTAPAYRIILMLALGAGLLIPVIIIFLREVSNTKVRGRKDIEHLTIPFVGEIPQYGNRKQRKKGDAGYKILVKPKSRNVINEAFRIVRANLEFVVGSNHPNAIIMITSANQGSGKTFLTANIASSFAVKEKRVAALDLDLRRATLSHFVDTPENGISDYLNGSISDWHKIICRIEGHEGLDILPVGTIPPNPAELLYSPRLQQLLESLKKEYDLILLDCPPVDVVADASIIAKWADMTVFVLRAGNIEREMLPVVEGYYQDKKFNNMTILLNGTMAQGRYGYHRYGYNYGYGYGYGYTKE